MSKCPSCQAECAPGSRFCMECGASLPENTGVQPQAARPLSSFGVVQSALAAQEAKQSISSTDNSSAPIASDIPTAPVTKKLLKVDVSKKELPTDTQAEPHPQLELHRAAPSEAPAVAHPFSAAENKPKDTGELRQWVENSVAQWSEEVPATPKAAPAQSAPRLLNAKPEPSQTLGQGGTVAAVAAAGTAAPFSAAAAAKDNSAPPQAPPKITAAPMPSATNGAKPRPHTQPVAAQQLAVVAKEEKDSKASKNFYSGLALGCCGGVIATIVFIIVCLMFIGAAVNK